VNFGYNPDTRSLNYRFVNARNGASGLNDSKGLAGACARGLMNTHGGQRGLLHQLSPMCTFSVGIVAMARWRKPRLKIPLTINAGRDFL
jgi:hypothetical protein